MSFITKACVIGALMGMGSAVSNPLFYPESSQPLPGSVTAASATPNFPTEAPPASFHGAATYTSWGATNDFARMFSLAYDHLSIRAEPKHGMWSWVVPGRKRHDIWWCELAGVWGTAPDGGHGNSGGQQNMMPVWDELRRAKNANVYGPLGRAAGIPELAKTAVRVYPSKALGANIWFNQGTESQPKYVAQRFKDHWFEVYMFEAHYGWPSMFDAEVCPPGCGSASGDGESPTGASGDGESPTGSPVAECPGTCGNLHTHLAIVVHKNLKSYKLSGTGTYGLHYGRDTACPPTCGAADFCICDGVLADLFFDAPLSFDLADPLAYLPKWALPAPASAPEACTDELAPRPGGPAMVHIKWAMLKSMPDFVNPQGASATLQDYATSPVPGKEMAAGCFRLAPGQTMDFTYTYDEFKWIIEGEFHLTDGSGKTVVAKSGDLMMFPTGTKVKFQTQTQGALGCYVGQRSGDASGVDPVAVQAAIDKNPAMVHFPNVMDRIYPLFENQWDSLSYLEDFAELGFKPGSEMTAGCYRLAPGPALFYTYEYEEMKFIMDGKFSLLDGTGKQITAEAGDLVYFPKDTAVKFEAVSTHADALGCYVGQRGTGEA